MDTATSVQGIPSDSSELSKPKQAAEDGANLESFTIFGKLPIELRHMIWEEGLPFPRRLLIFATKSYSLDPTEPFFRGAPPHVMFSACQESRQLAIGICRRAFKTEEHMSRFPSYIQFNPDFDTLYIPQHGFSFWTPDFVDDSVQYLAFPLSRIYIESPTAVAADLLNYRSLKELVLVRMGVCWDGFWQGFACDLSDYDIEGLGDSSLPMCVDTLRKQDALLHVDPGLQKHGFDYSVKLAEHSVENEAKVLQDKLFSDLSLIWNTPIPNGTDLSSHESNGPRVPPKFKIAYASIDMHHEPKRGEAGEE